MQEATSSSEDSSDTVDNADAQGGVDSSETTSNADVVHGSGLGQDSKPLPFRPWDWGTYRGYLWGLLGAEPGVFLLPLK